MKLLVLTSEPITAQQLRDALPGEVDPQDAEVMLVAPAVQENPLKFWMSDADQAIARAEEVRRESLEDLDAAGIRATGDTGESDPMLAIQDALNTFPADRILLFTHGGEGQGYREDLDDSELQQRFRIPVHHAAAK
jgi:hypothetical protein